MGIYSTSDWLLIWYVTCCNFFILHLFFIHQSLCEYAKIYNQNKILSYRCNVVWSNVYNSGRGETCKNLIEKNYTDLSNQLLLNIYLYEFPRLHLRQFAQLRSGLRSLLWKILVAISRSSSIHSVS